MSPSSTLSTPPDFVSPARGASATGKRLGPKAWLLVFCLLNAVQTALADTEAEVMQVLDEFMRSFNAMDAEAHTRTYLFPHYRLAGGQMTRLENAKEANALILKGFRQANPEWHHSAWVHRKLIHLSTDKAHVDTRFARYRKDGSLIETWDSLYVMEREDGRWGIRMRSSFAP